MIPRMMWEGWRAEIDLSVREAELSRVQREELHLRELRLDRRNGSRAAAGRRYAARSVGWVMRAAQMAASWIA